MPSFSRLLPRATAALRRLKPSQPNWLPILYKPPTSYSLQTPGDVAQFGLPTPDDAFRRKLIYQGSATAMSSAATASVTTKAASIGSGLMMALSNLLGHAPSAIDPPVNVLSHCEANLNQWVGKKVASTPLSAIPELPPGNTLGTVIVSTPGDYRTLPGGQPSSEDRVKYLLAQCLPGEGHYAVYPAKPISRFGVVDTNSGLQVAEGILDSGNTPNLVEDTLTVTQGRNAYGGDLLVRPKAHTMLTHDELDIQGRLGQVFDTEQALPSVPDLPYPRAEQVTVYHVGVSPAGNVSEATDPFGGLKLDDLKRDTSYSGGSGNIQHPTNKGPTVVEWTDTQSFEVYPPAKRATVASR